MTRLSGSQGWNPLTIEKAKMTLESNWCIQTRVVIHRGRRKISIWKYLAVSKIN